MIVQGSTQAGVPSASKDQASTKSSLSTSQSNDKARAEKAQPVQTLEAALEKAKETRKTLAAQRVEQLREQMRIMRWFAMASPKTAAQQAARMGKELAAAVRDYTDPGQGFGLPGQFDRNTLDITPEDDGAAIRQKLRAQLEILKQAKADQPKDKEFVVDTLALRASIAGLVDIAKSGARKDPSLRRDIGKAQEALQEVAGLLGQAPRSSIGVLNILT
ncbi:hypothetical protein [Pacificispira sp.]|uniref:hypothetical protein n=1 Tax=Pacificispira sp. TaxID=2888761 RepID=UPI003B5155D4